MTFVHVRSFFILASLDDFLICFDSFCCVSGVRGHVHVVMVTMVDIVWGRLHAMCLKPTRARWSSVCCHSVTRLSGAVRQRVVCLTLLLARFAVCASAAFELVPT